MSFAPIVALAPYALEAANLLGKFIYTLTKDEPDENDVAALEEAMQAFERSKVGRDAALADLRAKIEAAKAAQS